MRRCLKTTELPSPRIQLRLKALVLFTAFVAPLETWRRYEQMFKIWRFLQNLNVCFSRTWDAKITKTKTPTSWNMAADVWLPSGGQRERENHEAEGRRSNELTYQLLLLPEAFPLFCVVAAWGQLYSCNCISSFFFCFPQQLISINVTGRIRSHYHKLSREEGSRRRKWQEVWKCLKMSVSPRF